MANLDSVSLASSVNSVSFAQSQANRYMGITVDGTNGRFGLIVDSGGIGVWDYQQGMVIKYVSWTP